MPDPRKVRWSKLRVGLVATVAFIILFVLVFLLTSSRGLFRRYATLYTYMADASGMANGTAVELNGIPIGYLDHLQLTGSQDPKRAVEFVMKVQTKFLQDIPVDSHVGIAAANLLGEKFINITKGLSSQRVRDGAELPSVQTQDIPELMAQMSNVLDSFQSIVRRADNLLAGVEEGKGNIGLFLKDDELYRRMNAILAEGQDLLAAIKNGKGSLARLINDPTLYDDLDKPIKRLDSMLANIQAGQGTAGKLFTDPALFDDAHQTLDQIRDLVAYINSGKGTAGQLLKSDALSQQLNALVAKFNTTVDKINSGQGTLGQLMTNPQLYDALTGATREFQGLAKDIRANPKKFLTLRLALF